MSQSKKRRNGKLTEKQKAWFRQYVGDRIAEARIELGVTQRQLAQSLGLSLSMIQQLEIGIVKIPVLRLRDFERVLKMSIDDMIPKRIPAKPTLRKERTFRRADLYA